MATVQAKPPLKGQSFLKTLGDEGINPLILGCVKRYLQVLAEHSLRCNYSPKTRELIVAGLIPEDVSRKLYTLCARTNALQVGSDERGLYLRIAKPGASMPAFLKALEGPPPGEVAGSGPSKMPPSFSHEAIAAIARFMDGAVRLPPWVRISPDAANRRLQIEPHGIQPIRAKEEFLTLMRALCTEVSKRPLIHPECYVSLSEMATSWIRGFSITFVRMPLIELSDEGLILADSTSPSSSDAVTADQNEGPSAAPIDESPVTAAVRGKESFEHTHFFDQLRGEGCSASVLACLHSCLLVVAAQGGRCVYNPHTRDLLLTDCGPSDLTEQLRKIIWPTRGLSFVRVDRREDYCLHLANPSIPTFLEAIKKTSGRERKALGLQAGPEPGRFVSGAVTAISDFIQHTLRSRSNIAIVPDAAQHRLWIEPSCSMPQATALQLMDRVKYELRIQVYLNPFIHRHCFVELPEREEEEQIDPPGVWINFVQVPPAKIVGAFPTVTESSTPSSSETESSTPSSSETEAGDLPTLTESAAPPSLEAWASAAPFPAESAQAITRWIQSYLLKQPALQLTLHPDPFRITFKIGLPLGLQTRVFKAIRSAAQGQPLEDQSCLIFVERGAVAYQIEFERKPSEATPHDTATRIHLRTILFAMAGSMSGGGGWT